jgi:hypothetical protein
MSSLQLANSKTAAAGNTKMTIVWLQSRPASRKSVTFVIQIQAKLEFEGRQMKNPTRSTPQILSVRPDLVGYLLQDGWADLAQNFWRHAEYMAKGFLKKTEKTDF